MYSWSLLLHSWLRWVVVLLGLLVVARTVAAARSGRWSPTDERFAFFFSLALDLQFLLGLILYVWLSPVTAAAMRDVSAAMRNDQLRFWLVEHPVGMFAAIALVHIGRGRIRKALPAGKARRARVFFILAVLLILLSLPWPGLPYGRGLTRTP
jgi:hypothetical protein